MIILSATDLTKAYGVDTILDKVSFHVNAGDRIGIVGANGAGKTTLLEILNGTYKADSGDFFLPGDISVGYLRQKDDFDDKRTLLEEVHRIYGHFEKAEAEMHELSDQIAELAGRGEEGTEQYRQALKRYGDMQDSFAASGGFTYKSEMRGILNSMAFSEETYEKPINSLSGGERTRLALACLLMEKPDILMLDEPTNHLDIGMLKWLEQFLRAYKGTVIMVSHDRYFLDQLCNRIFEVSNRKLRVYEGNYTEYAEKKRAQREAELRAYNKQQDEIKRQEDLIRRYKERGTEKLARRAQSREKRLAQMDVLDKPEAERGSIRMDFRQDFQSGSDVLYADGLSKQFSASSGRAGRELFRNVSFDIKRGERICIVGPNGIGKTTLLRIMIGDSQPTTGLLRTGHNVEFAYYDQRQQQLDPAKSVMEELHDSFRLYKDSEIRSILGRFLFKGDSVFTQVGSLSGGEKARLALLKLMLSGANCLVLDEPTNHLDIDSKEVFEEALKEYPGTIIAVSHDRYFLNSIATRIFELNADGLMTFEGGYDYYEEKRAQISSVRLYIGGLAGGASGAAGSDASGNAGRNDAAAEGTSGQGGRSSDNEDAASAGLDAKALREEKKRKAAEARRNERERLRLEELIEALETEIAELETEMCKPEYVSDIKALNRMDTRLRAAKEELDDAYDAWAELG